MGADFRGTDEGRDRADQGRPHRAARCRAGLPDGRHQPEPAHLPELDRQRHHGGHRADVHADGRGSHRDHRMAARPAERAPRPSRTSSGQLPDVPGSGWVRDPGRHRGPRIVPARLLQRWRAMERHLQGYGPRSASHRRGADEGVLAAMERPSPAPQGIGRCGVRPLVISPDEAPAVASLVETTRADVGDLLVLEAELLDEWALDEWVALYTPDSRYVVPSTDDRDGDPDSDLMLIDDDGLRLRSRVERLKSRKAHREYPHPNPRHLVSNVRLRAVEGDELLVTAAFVVFRFR